MNPATGHLHLPPLGGQDDDLFFNHDYFDPNQPDFYGQMDLPSFAVGGKFELSPRLRLSGGSSGISLERLSGGLSGMGSGLGSAGSEGWLGTHGFSAGGAPTFMSMNPQGAPGGTPMPPATTRPQPSGHAHMHGGDSSAMMMAYPTHPQTSAVSPPHATLSPGTTGERRDSDPPCTGPVMVTLYHRTRAAKGWSLINSQDEVRVTKDRGKVLRVRAECKCEFGKDDITVELIDLKAVRTESTREGVQIISISVPQRTTLSNGEQITSVDIEVKLSKICKLLQLRVGIKNAHSCCYGTSIEFTTHNSGTKPLPASAGGSSAPRVNFAGGSSPNARNPQGGSRVFPSSPPPPPPPQQRPHQLHHNPQPQFPPQHQHHQQPVPQATSQQQAMHHSPQSHMSQSSSPHSYDSPIQGGMLADSKKRKLDEPSALSGHQPRGETFIINGGLDVEGIVRADAFLQYSDLRLKTEIEDIVDALSMISKLDGKRYRWKKDNPKFPERGGEKAIGLIAQEVQKVVPEAVVEDEDGYLSVAYAELIPVLISAFKQHLENYNNDKEVFQQEFENLRQEIKNNKRLSTMDELNQLTKQMSTLLAAVNNSKSEHDVEMGGMQRMDVEDKKETKRAWSKRKKIILAAVLLGVLLLAVGVIIAIAVPVAVASGGSSSSSNGNSGNNGNGNGNKKTPSPTAAAVARAVDEPGEPPTHAYYDAGTRTKAGREPLREPPTIDHHYPSTPQHPNNGAES